MSVTKIDPLSDSIENQKKIIHSFVNSRPDITLEYFYIDEKSSDTKFDRKAFNEMIENINNGNVDCVIVKDLSRLGRNLIDVGYYIQQYFPSKRVQFISVSDRFETLDGITNLSFERMWGIKDNGFT